LKPQGLHLDKLESPGPKDVPCLILLHSGSVGYRQVALKTKQKQNKRPNGPVSLTWFLPYIFLYQSMTKGCYTPNINAFRPVIQGKKMFQVFCYINLYKNVSPLRAWSFMTPGTLFELT